MSLHANANAAGEKKTVTHSLWVKLKIGIRKWLIWIMFWMPFRDHPPIRIYPSLRMLLCWERILSRVCFIAFTVIRNESSKYISIFFRKWLICSSQCQSITHTDTQSNGVGFFFNFNLKSISSKPTGSRTLFYQSVSAFCFRVVDVVDFLHWILFDLTSFKNIMGMDSKRTDKPTKRHKGEHTMHLYRSQVLFGWKVEFIHECIWFWLVWRDR